MEPQSSNPVLTTGFSVPFPDSTFKDGDGKVEPAECFGAITLPACLGSKSGTPYTPLQFSARVSSNDLQTCKGKKPILGFLVILMMVDEAEWSMLHGDFLWVIVNAIRSSSSPSDYIRFSAVCRSWMSFCHDHFEQISLPSQLPVLLIPTPPAVPEEEEEDEKEVVVKARYYDPKDAWWQEEDSCRLHKSTRSFYSISHNKVHTDFKLQVPYMRNCRSSTHGWLFTVEEVDGDCSIRLLNPFRSVRNEIQLPPLSALELDYDSKEPLVSDQLLKAVISGSPSNNPADLTVFAIYSCYKAALWRPGDVSWTCLPIKEYEDAIFYNGHFYAIEYGGDEVVRFEFSNNDDGRPLPPKPVKVAEPIVPKRRHVTKKYIVESMGELLQVHRYVEIRADVYFTVKFWIYRLQNWDSPGTKWDWVTSHNWDWVEIKTLDGRFLFLGHNTSMSLSATDCPGCKPNCIYFTDDYGEGYEFKPFRGPHDIGVSHLKDGSYEPHYNAVTDVIVPAPIWIQPML